MRVGEESIDGPPTYERSETDAERACSDLVITFRRRLDLGGFGSGSRGDDGGGCRCGGG